MSLGRNEPCHCGSGKKCEKCCLSKEEEARHAHTAADLQYKLDHKTGERTPDPRVEAVETRMREFHASDYEDKFTVFIRTLDEPELVDAETAFEMLSTIFRMSAERGERDRLDGPDEPTSPPRRRSVRNHSALARFPGNAPAYRCRGA